jgi:hypothetical protein
MLHIFLILVMFELRSGIVLSISNSTNAEVWPLQITGMKNLFTGINTPDTSGFGAEKDATIFIELETEEEDDDKYVNSITDYLHVIILNHHEETSTKSFIPENPVVTKRYQVPIGSRNESALVVIEDVIPSLDQYYIYFVNLWKISYKVQGKIVLENSWGHLDYDERYFPFYSQLGFYGYSVEFLIWLTLLYNERRFVVTVHILLAAFVLLQVITKWLSWMFTAKLNRTGELITSEVGTISACQGLLDILGLLAMLMFSCGYQMRGRVDQKKVRFFVWTVVSYIITCVAHSFCYLSRDMCHLIFLMRFVFGSCLLLGVI